MKTPKKEINKMNQLYKDIEKYTISDKRVLNSIDREESVMGKQLLICEQLQQIETKLPSKEAKNQLILYLIRLFKYNAQIYESVKKELDDDSKLLKKRVEIGFKKGASKEIYNNVLRVADHHFKIGKEHLNQLKPQDATTHHHANLALRHKNEAEELYNLLTEKGVRRVIKRLALMKLTDTYKKLIERCEALVKVVSSTVRIIESGKKATTEVYEIHRFVVEQNLILRHFALNYSKSLIHSAEYIDFLNNRVVLYHHK